MQHTKLRRIETVMTVKKKKRFLDFVGVSLKGWHWFYSWERETYIYLQNLCTSLWRHILDPHAFPLCQLLMQQPTSYSPNLHVLQRDTSSQEWQTSNNVNCLSSIRWSSKLDLRITLAVGTQPFGSHWPTHNLLSQKRIFMNIPLCKLLVSSGVAGHATEFF